jgi:hypothetical protein
MTSDQERAVADLAVDEPRLAIREHPRGEIEVRTSGRVTSWYVYPDGSATEDAPSFEPDWDDYEGE